MCVRAYTLCEIPLSLVLSLSVSVSLSLSPSLSPFERTARRPVPEKLYARRPLCLRFAKPVKGVRSPRCRSVVCSAAVLSEF